MKNRTNGYDETKKLLNKLRSFNYTNKSTSQNIKEQVQPEVSEPVDTDVTQKQMDDITVINDVEVKILSPDQEDLEVTGEQKEAITQLIDNFKQQVSQIVEFEPGMTINENQIRLDGRLTDEDIGFVFISGSDSGTYLNLDMTKLDQNVRNAIDKLLKFEMTFKTAMDPLISDRTNT
jgi:hypothetical protein